MLQVSSGKFFPTTEYYETPHQGVFYTNYSGLQLRGITTSIGMIMPGEGVLGIEVLSYQIIERIEWEEAAPGVLISTGGKELVNDFADVTAFILNITCTTNEDMARRLFGPATNGSDDYRSPRKYLRRVFNERVGADPGDEALAVEFSTALIGLKREHYDSAIRAIRRYVAAAHRVADDTSLAYALLVMSIEVLAQTTDSAVAKWADYDEEKRRVIDKSLDGASEEIAAAVRAAVLENEHVAISRRFREFTIAHMSPAYFRSEASGAVQPVGRPDLVPALKRAYDIRSGYVHRLKDVPKLLSPPFNHAEIMLLEGHPTLTFEGLARLARHVIIQFIKRAPKVEREEFNWRAILPNLLTMQMAPQYWIGRPEGYMPDTARLWLQTFLSQVSSVIARSPGATITDLTAILEKIDSMAIDGISKDSRRPIIVLYHLFIVIAGPNHERPNHVVLLNKYDKDFKEPSIEELVVRLITGEELPWAVPEIESLHASYYRERRFKKTLLIGEFLEAIFTLRLAEANRLAGNEKRARELVAFAVEALPAHAGLRSYEAGLEPEKLNPITSREILLGPDQTSVASIAEPEQARRQSD